MIVFALLQPATALSQPQSMPSQLRRLEDNCMAAWERRLRSGTPWSTLGTLASIVVGEPACLGVLIRYRDGKVANLPQVTNLFRTILSGTHGVQIQIGIFEHQRFES